METRASYVLVGTFVLGLVAAAVIFVLWIGGGTPTDKVSYRVILTGNVTGLAPGAAVRYRGIQKGEVGEIKLRAPTPYEVERFKVAMRSSMEIRSPDTPIFTDDRSLARRASRLAFRPAEGRDRRGRSIQEQGTRSFRARPPALTRFSRIPKAIASITELANKASGLLDQENEDAFKSMLKNASML